MTDTMTKLIAHLVQTAPATGGALTPAQLTQLAAEVDLVLGAMPADERAEFLRGVLRRVNTGNAEHDDVLLKAGHDLRVADLADKTGGGNRRPTADGTNRDGTQSGDGTR